MSYLSRPIKRQITKWSTHHVEWYMAPGWEFQFEVHLTWFGTLIHKLFGTRLWDASAWTGLQDG